MVYLYDYRFSRPLLCRVLDISKHSIVTITMEDLQDDSVNEFYGSTKINVIKLKYEWKVHNFSVCPKKTGEFISSPKFSAPNDDIQWNLDLYPKGHESDCKDFVSVFLKFTQTEKTKEVEVKMKFYVLDKQEKKHCQCQFEFHYEASTGYGHGKFMKRSEIKGNENLLPNDCLTLVCEFTASRNIINGKSQPNYSKRQRQLKILSNQESFLNNQEFYDVKLVAAGKKFCAHKAFLAAQSPVFLRMFNNDMKEKNENQVELADVDAEVLEELLLFIYSGKIKNMAINVYGLLAVADKYAIEELKSMCKEYLCSNLNIDNVVNVLSLADLHNAVDLKKHAMNFLVVYKNEFRNSDAFNSIDNLKPNILKEIIDKLMSK